MEIEEQEKIFTEIYNECDNNNVNNVQVSVLLSYIGPYIDSSSHHFEELKKSLDPNDLNPFIDKQTFLEAMLCWSEEFKNEVDFNFNNEEISRQSSPTTVTLKVDYDALNLSSISGYSLTGSILSTIDPNILQEQNNELQHQNKKLTDCLDDVKYQLTILEEQNVTLQNQIDRADKTSTLDQKLIKTLQTKCAEYEREREEHTKILHENKVNHENLILNKRIISELETSIKELETQNKTQLETIEKLADALNEKQEQSEHLLKRITDKDVEMQEKEMEYKQNQLKIEYFILETNELKNYIRSLETQRENNVEDDKSLKMEQFEPGINSTPIQYLKRSRFNNKNTNQPYPIFRLSSSQHYTQTQHIKRQQLKPRAILYSLPNTNCILNESVELKEKETETEMSTKLNKNNNQHKSRSLSPEEDLCVRLERRTSPHESLLAEMANISATGCFHSCEYRINQLEDELSKVHEELRLREGQLQDAQSANVQLEIQLTNANKNVQTFNDRYDMLTIEINDLKKNLEAMSQDKQQLQIERKQMHSRMSYYKVINKNFKMALDTKTSEIITLKKQLKTKEEQLLQIEEMEKEIKTNLNKVNTEITLKENEYKVQNEKMIKMQQQLGIFENEMKELKEINCKLMNEISSLERGAKLERKRNTRVDLNSKINELEEQLEMVKSKNYQLASSVSSLSLEKKQLISKLELLENNEYSKRKVECLEAKLHKYRKNLTDLENQISTKTKDSEQLSDENKKMRESYNGLLALIEHLKTTINTNIDLLKSTIYYTADIWTDILAIVFPELNLLNLLSTNTNTNTNNIDVDKNEILSNEIDLLNNQINVTTILLKAFAIMKNKLKMKNMNEESTSTNRNRSLLNHESKNETSFFSRITPKRFSLKPPMLLIKPKNKVQFVYPPPPSIVADTLNVEIPEKDVPTNKNELNNNKMDEIINGANTSANNSTFTKTCTDSFIEKILAEQKIAAPVEQINSNDEKLISSKQEFGEEQLEVHADKKDEEIIIKERLARQVRSLSEGAPLINQLSKNADGDVLVFPHLQDATLNQLDLIPKTIIYNSQLEHEEQEHEPHEDEHREQDDEDDHITIKEHALTEEEVEEKFQTLAFAFSIDALTIKGRLEMQQRQRDQAERNLNAEIIRLKKVISQLQQQEEQGHNHGGERREQRELINVIWERMQLVVQATQRVSTCAQILGSFQQEWRISEAVNLMLTHLKNVIKQRDATRKQLQITKKMLQETTSPAILKKPSVMTTRRLTINTLPTGTTGIGSGTGTGISARNIILPPRRASIAVISHQQQQLKGKIVSSNVPVEPLALSNKYWDCKRIPDRDRDRRPTLLLTSSRTSRLDLNPELTKIQEGLTENFTNHSLNNDDHEEQDAAEHEDSTEDEDVMEEYETPTTLLLENPLVTLFKNANSSNTDGTNIWKKVLKYYAQLAARVFNEWAANGTLHEICFIGTIVCFAMATILLANTIMEIEVAREGVRQIPWKWLTWQEIYSFLS